MQIEYAALDAYVIVEIMKHLGLKEEKLPFVHLKLDYKKDSSSIHHPMGGSSTTPLGGTEVADCSDKNTQRCNSGIKGTK